MKNYLSLLGIVLLIIGCSKTNEFDQIDVGLLGNLNLAINNSSAYNDSLSISSIDSLRHYHDEMFHQHYSLYQAYHAELSHGGEFDDHVHDGHGTHQSGTMKCNHNGVIGHHMEDHQALDSLLSVHENFHPNQ